VLVLTRKPGERIVIGSTVTLELRGVDATHKASLAFQSPHALRLTSSEPPLALTMPSGGPDQPACAVLALGVNESVTVNDEVTAMVVALRGEQVRIGFTAPKHVEIFREEVYLEIQRENILAAQASGKLSADEVQKAMRDLERGKT